MIDRLVKPINKLYNLYLLRRQHVKYGANLAIHGRLYLLGNVMIGDNVAINSGYKYNPIGGQERTILFTRGYGKIKIGSNVGISNCAIFSACQVEIEDNVKLGGSCKIYDNDFHSIQYDQRITISDTNIKSAPILIKEGAFIGAHSIILKGVTIGKHSVIGAGSVVTKIVPDGEIWGGNPAHFIKRVKE